MKKQKNLKTLTIILSVFLFLFMLVGFLLAYLPTRMTQNHTNKIVNMYLSDVKFSSVNFETKWKNNIKTFKLDSKDKKYKIPVFYISKNNKTENNTIILVHWHESNHKAMYPLAQEFLDKGYNVVLYDQRSHGENAAKTVTFGFKESEDLKQVINFTKEKTKDYKLGLLGQSMGASTVAYYSGTKHAKQNIDFCIIDSAYDSMYKEIESQINKSKIPLPSTLLTNIGNRFCKMIYGFSFKEVDIAKQIKSNEIPTLVIHSECDELCPYNMGKEIYKNIPHKNKEFLSYKKSKHLFAYWDNKDNYINEILKFIK